MKNTAAYARAALDGVLRDLLGAAPGERNHTLNAAAYRLGRLAASGVVEQAEAIAALTEAAARLQMDSREAQRTIKSGLSSGLREPVEIGQAHQERPPEPPARPPADELADLWNRASRVDSDAACRSWLASRSIDARLVADFDLARALPGGALPSWCASWRGGGWRVLVPLYDHKGVMRSIRGRRTSAEHPKDLAPAGFKVAGLAMLDGTARSQLADGGLRDVLIAEGTPDFLDYATNPREHMPAIVSIFSGSWNDDWTQSLVNGARVKIRTHPDSAGEKYAEDIRASIRRAR